MVEPVTNRGLNPSWIIVAAGVSASLHVGKLPPAVPLLQQQLGIISRSRRPMRFRF